MKLPKWRPRQSLADRALELADLLDARERAELSEVAYVFTAPPRSWWHAVQRAIASDDQGDLRVLVSSMSTTLVNDRAAADPGGVW